MFLSTFCSGFPPFVPKQSGGLPDVDEFETICHELEEETAFGRAARQAAPERCTSIFIYGSGLRFRHPDDD